MSSKSSPPVTLRGDRRVQKRGAAHLQVKNQIMKALFLNLKGGHSVGLQVAPRYGELDTHIVVELKLTFSA